MGPTSPGINGNLYIYIYLKNMDLTSIYISPIAFSIIPTVQYKKYRKITEVPAAKMKFNPFVISD